MKYLLDSDHASILERKSGSDYAVLVLNLNQHQNEGVGISVATYHEQTLGAHTRIVQAKSSAELLRGYEMLFMVIEQHRQFPLLPFDAVAHLEYQNLVARKIRIGTMDLRIAAIALARNLTLVTRNVADFGKVPNLVHVDWTK